MGQLALGFRSLLFKVAVFVTMAALLAWILGGTLFPHPVTAIQAPTLTAGGTTWAWQVSIEPLRHEVTWHLMRQTEDGWAPVPAAGPFDTVMPLVLPTVAAGDVLFTLHASKRGAGFVALKVHTDGTVGPAQPVAATATD